MTLTLLSVVFGTRLLFIGAASGEEEQAPPAQSTAFEGLWVPGPRGVSCEAVCREAWSTGVCLENQWPTKTEEFETVLANMDVGCSIAGNHDPAAHHPSSDGSSCFWRSNATSRCDATPPEDVHRLCPCTDQRFGLAKQLFQKLGINVSAPHRAHEVADAEDPWAKQAYHRSCRMSGGSCPLASMPRDQSTLVYPGGRTRCISREHEYAFQVVPGDSDKLLIYFAGGGACWDLLTYWTQLACTRKPHANDGGGIFDRHNHANPFRRFTIVHILYCSGDVHIGDTSHAFWLDVNWRAAEQRGYSNSKAALDWANENFGSLSSLVIGGESAGSVGAHLWAGSILDMFARRSQQASVFLDSFAAVLTISSQNSLLRAWDVCSTDLVSERFGQQCHSRRLSVQHVFEDTLVEYSGVRFAHINSKTDETQVLYYNLWSLTGGLWGGKLGGAQYYRELTDMFDQYNQHPNWVSFQVDGSQHTFTPHSFFFTTDATGKNGKGRTPPTLSEWLATFMAKHPGDGLASVCHGEELEGDELPYRGVGTDYCSSSQVGKVLRVTPRGEVVGMEAMQTGSNSSGRKLLQEILLL